MEDVKNLYRAGMYLRDIRKQEGLTLKQMEEKTGIAFQMISHLERGEITDPSGKTLGMISIGYRLPIEEVYRMFGYELYAPVAP